MVRADELHIDLGSLRILEMPRRIGRKMFVKVNAKGYFTVSSAFMEELKGMFPTMEMEIRISDDARVLVFRSPELYKFRMCKTGHFKHLDFMAELKKHGYKLPAEYSIAWNPSMNAWVGILQEVEEAPDVRNFMDQEEVRRKSRRRKNAQEQ